eukprot:1137651-Pelagomonas_calceolata.AAC.4
MSPTLLPAHSFLSSSPILPGPRPGFGGPGSNASTAERLLQQQQQLQQNPTYQRWQQQQQQQQQKQEARPKPANAPSSPSNVRRIHLPPIQSKRAQLSDKPLPQLQQQQNQQEDQNASRFLDPRRLLCSKHAPGEPERARGLCFHIYCEISAFCALQRKGTEWKGLHSRTCLQGQLGCKGYWQGYWQKVVLIAVPRNRVVPLKGFLKVSPPNFAFFMPPVLFWGYHTYLPALWPLVGGLSGVGRTSHQGPISAGS